MNFLDGQLALLGTNQSSSANETTSKYDPVRMETWTHDPRISTEDVIIDMNLLPGAGEGDIAELQTLDEPKKRLLFVVKPMGNELAKRMSGVSLQTGNLLTMLNLANRSEVIVRLREKDEVRADSINIFFRDSHLTRADMWRLSASLSGQCLYTGQNMVFLDSIKTTIGAITLNGNRVSSAYVNSKTNIVFRSESARMIIFIEMAKEMWHFEESGEIIFNKLVNSFLPSIFRHWRDNGAHHVVTIVLFTSVNLSPEKVKLSYGERLHNTEDYFRVVVDQVVVSKWSDIMERLTKEFTFFAKTVLLQDNIDKPTINGRIIPSVKGNVMEAINLATSLITGKFVDRDLKRTGVQVVIVSPGSGIYDVDYDLFKRTSQRLQSMEVGIDLVCLSREPLHITPLFRYRDFRGQLKQCIPTWLDISFWSGSKKGRNIWTPRCKIYEVQMMGVMENEMSSISIDYLPFTAQEDSKLKLFEEYDKEIFKMKRNMNKSRFCGVKGETRGLYNPSHSKFGKNFKDLTQRFPVKKSLLPLSSNKSSVSLSNDIVFEAKYDNVNSRTSALSSLLSLNDRPFPAKALGFLRKPPSLSLIKAETALQTSNKLSPEETSGSNNNEAPEKPASNNYPPRLETLRRGDYSFKARKSVTPDLSSSSDALVRKGKGDKLKHSKVKSNSLWIEIENPSNVKIDDFSTISVYGRWHCVFPTGSKRRLVKWLSLGSPASLPLKCRVFPEVDEFLKFKFQIYDVALDPDQLDEMSARDLLREMIALRISLGFQICVGGKVQSVESKRYGTNHIVLYNDVPKNYFGTAIYLSMMNHIHRISCDYNGNINVQAYTTNDVTEEDNELTTSRIKGSKLTKYIPKIKTRYEESYIERQIEFSADSKAKTNWNQFDQLLAGYEDAMMEDKKVFRIRLAMIPCEIEVRNLTASNKVLTNEELRLEGIKILTSMFHKGRYMSKEEKKRFKERKKVFFPYIQFYTGGLAKSMLQLHENSLERSDVRDQQDTITFNTNERLTRSTKLAKLSQEMQGPKGIRLIDRIWHWNFHQHCFIGQEFADWLIRNFSDIDTTEEAVEYGNELMKKGLFDHVEKRHKFLDGYYFYQLQAEYVISNNEKKKLARNTKPAAGWFKRIENHNGSSEVISNEDGSDQTPTNYQLTSDICSDSSTDVAPVNLADNNGQSSGPPPTVELSRAVKYDVDPLNRSYRPEIVTLHYDRIHNPENGYHLKLEWLNTTPRLIDDAISRWKQVASKYGFRVVELPMEEIGSMSDTNPFCSLMRIRIRSDILEKLECTSSRKIKNPVFEDPKFYHKAVLSKFGFALDTEAAPNLSTKDIEITYSWGKPYYKNTQYVHKSGNVLAQIMDDGELLLMTNSLHLSRYDGQQDDSDESFNRMRPGVSTRDQKGYYKYQRAQSVKCEDNEYDASKIEDSDPESIQNSMKEFCNDSGGLKLLIVDAAEEWEKTPVENRTRKLPRLSENYRVLENKRIKNLALSNSEVISSLVSSHQCENHNEISFSSDSSSSDDFTSSDSDDDDYDIKCLELQQEGKLEILANESRSDRTITKKTNTSQMTIENGQNNPSNEEAKSE
ncbi:hypothetical protein NADFUDRAFT_50580 [Nadsonia fulvescens var. elongata DSM 6958]|uniref:Vacuolar membrane-associated protein IML1 n=1 Tax=Nadsonia fulvescens var. elongata DSM 6958 TaxID=857566 RepID=A0A1E3PMZ9_9ASCO|nr:hypothetical protein NADFUDRAFT_50580 [Nadsonia fulvescens var. elongata DSM 6958]